LLSSLLPQYWFSHKTKKNLDPRQGSKQRRMRTNVQLPIPSIIFYLLATHLLHVLCKEEIFRQTHKWKISFRTKLPCPGRCQLWQTCRRETNNGSDRSFSFSVCVCVARTRVREWVHSSATKSKALISGSVLGGQSCGGQEKG
jgi:hypothetical protein